MGSLDEIMHVLNGVFYFSIFLIVLDEILQDYFVGFHFRTGFKVDQKDIPFGPDEATFAPGQKAKTEDAIYFCTPDGKSCFFRIKHVFYNPFVMPFHLKGMAVKTDKAWRVTIRMNVGVLMFFLVGLSLSVHPYLGFPGAMAAFWGIKKYGLSQMWEYFEQMQKSLR